MGEHAPMAGALWCLTNTHLNARASRARDAHRGRPHARGGVSTPVVQLVELVRALGVVVDLAESTAPNPLAIRIYSIATQSFQF